MRSLVLFFSLLASACAVTSSKRQPTFKFEPSAAAARVVSADGAKVRKPAPKPKARARTGSTKKAGKKPAVAVSRGFGEGGDGTKVFPTDLGKIKYGARRVRLSSAWPRAGLASSRSHR